MTEFAPLQRRPEPERRPEHLRQPEAEPADLFFGALDYPLPQAPPRAPRQPVPAASPAVARPPVQSAVAPAAPAAILPSAAALAATAPDAPPAARTAVAEQVAARSGARAAGRVVAAAKPEDYFFGPDGAAGGAAVPAARARGAPAPPLVDGETPGPEEIRARAALAAASLSHPHVPSPAGGAARLAVTRDAIAARGAARAQSGSSAPRQLVRAPPSPQHAPPREEPGPIPAQMDAIRDKSGRALPAATLPAVTASPRGTVPDLTGPIISTEELRVINIGEEAINAFAPNAEERARLTKLRNDLAAPQTANAPAPGNTAATTAPPAPASVPVQDEPVAGLQLDPQQRAYFTRVIGELRRDMPAEAGNLLTTIRTRHRMYPGGVLQRAFPDLGKELLPQLEAAVQQQTGALADALGLVPTQIEAAIEERGNEVETLRQQAAQATAAAAGQAQAAATNQAHRTSAAAARSVDATSRAVAADRRAAEARRPHGVREQIDHVISSIRQKISTENARYDTQLRNRERALDVAVRRQVSAIRVAQTRDELALQATGASRTATAAEVRRWADTQVAALQEGDASALKRLTFEARRSTWDYKRELDQAGGAAFGALREWAGRQSTASEQWWAQLDADLDNWAKSETARALQWQAEKGEEERLALAQDFAAVRRVIELQRQHDAAGARAYLETLDGESRVVMAELSHSAERGAPDLAGALSAGLRERLRAAHQWSIENELHDLLMALPNTEDNVQGLEIIAAVTDHGLDLETRIGDIHASVTQWRGFDEQKIFRALEGLSPVGGKLLRIEYERIHHQSLDEALHGHGHVGWLNEDEFHTAQQMLAGDENAKVNGAIGAINSAISGLGTDKDAIKRILRGLTDEQRQDVLAGYRERYGEGLDEAIRGEWIGGSQKDEIIALSESRIRDADAIALGRTVETHYTQGDETGGGGERYATIDRADAQAVFAQVRSEVEAAGSRGKWTTAEVEAEIALRNQEVERQFNIRHADEWWAKEGAPGTSAMRSAFALQSGAGRDLLNAVADNDLTKMDVARLRLEDEGAYAEDAAINAVFRDQNSRSFAEVNRDLGPILRARAEAQLADEAEKGHFPSEADRLNRRMELERQTAAELTRLADERTKSRFATLGASYQAVAGRSLADMVEANMSGASRDEARARVDQSGVVTNYQRVRFAIEGAGTDLPMLRSALESMTPEERERAIKQWPKDHDGESLEDAIRGDTSGRDEDDMMDLLDHGSPQTVDEQVAAARRRFNRDREGSSALGDWLTSDEVDEARYEVEHAEADLARLHRRDLSPAERERTAAHFDIVVDRANTAIELQRNAVDAWADMLSNAVALVVAVAVGAAIEFFSGGLATPLVIAVVSSLAATAASMATKRLVKGTAYGLEEFETDLAVGAVDVLVASLTAGLGNALLGEAGRGASSAARSGMNQTLKEMGRLTGAAARAESGFARVVSRGPRVGLLARAVERTGLFEGLELGARPMWQRIALRGAAHVVESGIQSLPTSFVASIADERAWRQPGGVQMVWHNTISGAAHNTVMGLGFAAAHAGFSHALGALRERVPAGRVPTSDVLDRIGTPRERLNEFRAWRAENPEGTYRDFYNERQAKAIEQQRTGAETAQQLRNARRELLADLPPHERAGFADVPILSATDAELRRLVGERAGDAHVVIRDGQAVIVIREGAPASAVRPLLGEIRDRVFAHTGGMTLEGALPSHLRDLRVRRLVELPTDTVLVVPIPPEGGPIRGVEVLIGPDARPVDVALHADAVERVRRWTGAIGEARMAAARVAEFVSLQVESPHDRVRFEAAEEVRKLQPIIEERVRRMAAVAENPVLMDRIEAETLHLLAQQERARRILTGELTAEPRGFIAAIGLDKPRPVTEPAIEPAPGPHEPGAAAREPGAAPPRPEGAVSDRDVLASANKITERMAELRYSEARHLQYIGETTRRMNMTAAELYDGLLREGLATRAELGDREAFGRRFAGSSGEFANARNAVLSMLPEGHPLRRQLDTIGQARVALDERSGYLDKTRNALSEQQRQLGALPDVAQAKAQLNQGLDYSHLEDGPNAVCVPPETPVLTPSGSVAIASLRAGDVVLAGDGCSGRPEPAVVTRTMQGWTDWLVEITAGGQTLHTTRSHRVRCAGERGWVPARLVVPGMQVASAGGELTVQRCRLVRCETRTHNLEVSTHHSYFAGDGAVLVHNGNEIRPSRDLTSTVAREAEVYYISVLREGRWELEYVGSTNKRGLTFARFAEHIGEGRPGNVDFRPDKRHWAELYDALGARTVISPDGRTLTRGAIRVEIRVKGQYTDLALAIVEQAHIFLNDRGQLVNVEEAISRKTFEKYYTNSEVRRAHAPCR